MKKFNVRIITDPDHVLILDDVVSFGTVGRESVNLTYFYEFGEYFDLSHDKISRIEIDVVDIAES